MDFLNKLKNKVLILDGAMGTQLQIKGMPVGVCPEKWCADNPDVLSEIHSNYINAGSDIIYTCTFGANSFKLAEYGISNSAFTNAALAKIAKKAAKAKALVAGDIGPTGKFIFPYGEVSFEDAVETFKEQVKGLLDGDVDLFVIETMMDLQEARAAVIAIKELTDKPVMVTMTFDKGGRTLNGNDPLSALITLQGLGIDAFGCNCSVGPDEMISIIKQLKPYANIPLIAKPNAGLPRLENDKTIFDMPADIFGKKAPELVRAGANLIGGCCGTAPEYIQAVSEQLKYAVPILPSTAKISSVCSSRKTVLLDKSYFTPIGEKINPTGKKFFQKALKEGDLSVIKDAAKEQIANGAILLDVNVGAPDINETELLEKAIGLLCPIVDVPLVIDSSDINALKHALRLYPGKALINSISAEETKIKEVLPLAKKYGAMFIALPLNSKKIPKTFDERKAILKTILSESAKLNIENSSIIVDALAFSISSNPEAVNEILNTIQWANKELGVNTVLGLSNISFGLPRRDLINAAFLALAKEKGLSCAIMDPSLTKTQITDEATKVLKGEDKDAKQYIAYATGLKQTPELNATKTITPEKLLYKTVLEGDRDYIEEALDKVLQKGLSAQDILNNHMIPAINEAGAKFECKELFLPQLLASAQTMKKGFAKIKPLLGSKQNLENKTVVVATVEGDIHDIGKNIVSLMLQNQGITVIDLGNDVSAEIIIDAIEKHNPTAVGLSALMTTTMVNMKTVINLACSKGLKTPFILGGAVLTAEYAQSIGGIYGGDAVSTVNIIKNLG